jgi:hypothetical protein
LQEKKEGIVIRKMCQFISGKLNHNIFFLGLRSPSHLNHAMGMVPPMRPIPVATSFVAGSGTRQTAVTTTPSFKPATDSAPLQPQQQISSFKHALLGNQSNLPSSIATAPVPRFPSVWERDEVKRMVKGKYIITFKIPTDIFF